MATYPVKVLEVARGLNSDGTAPKPTPRTNFDVSSETVDGARTQVYAELAKLGKEVRSVSFTTDGGIQAVVFA